MLTFQYPGDTTVPAAFTLEQFAIYWSQFWERDHPSTQEDPEAWSTLEALLSQMPAPPEVCQLDMLDVASWKAGVKRLTAQGTCGFHADEFKLLGDSALLDLARIVAGFSDGWPNWIMVSRV